MRKLVFIFSILTILLCGVNLYAQTVEEIEFEITDKEVQGSGRYANLVLYGQHDTYGKIIVYLNEYNATYKDYEVYYATLGSKVLTGTANWSKTGNIETLDATLSTAEFDAQPSADDQIYHIIGTYVQETTVTLNFSGFSTFGYDPNYNDWFMRIEGTDPSTPEYGYKVELAYYAPANNGYGTFTSANNQINMADSYIHTPMGDVLLDSVTLTVEKKIVSENLQQTIANATLLGRDGVTYIVNCTHNSITPKTQITAEINNALLVRGADNFSLEGESNDIEALITINSSELIGKYAMKHFDLKETRFFHNNERLDILSVQAEVLSELQGEDLKCVANVALLTRDTILYVIKMIHTFPAPTQFVDLKATNLIVNDIMAQELQYVNIDAKNDDYILSGIIAGTEVQAGTYSQEQVAIELQDIHNNLTIHALHLNIDFTMDNTAHWVIKGTMRGDDNVVYSLDLSYVVPTPKDTVVLRFDHSARAIFTPDMNNDLLFENEDERYYASVNVRGVEMGGNFTIQDVDREFCGVRDSLTGSFTELADIYGNIFQIGDTTIMQAELISMDATLYDIELWYVVPSPTDTVTLSFPVSFGDMRNEEGYYQLYGPSPDTSYVVAFSPLSDEIEGTFVNDGLFGKLGAEGGRMELDYRNTYIATMDGPYVNSIMPLEKGQMTVQMDAEGNITAVAEAICADGIYYHITMTAKYEREYLRGDKESGEVDKTYTANDQVLLDDYSDQGYLYLTIASADFTDMVAMHFFVDSTDAEILIPEGTYKINKSYRPGTVLGNAGPDEQNQLSTPFYATITPDGYLQDVYMWVRGTVTVTNKDGKLYLEVNALNSYDVPVHIVYDATLTDVQNVLLPDRGATKYIHNGQLLIRKDGVEYNAIGVPVK